MLIEVQDVWREYDLGGAEPVRALRGVSLEIERGEFVALLGRSGSGKSTLLNQLGGLDRPSRGDILVEGRSLVGMSHRQLSLYRRATIGFVFQSFNLVPTLLAWENVALPLAFSGVGSRERRRRAGELLELVGLGGRQEHRPTEMSGGEQQRVAIARSLVNAPSLLLADEPTGNLDTNTSDQIMELILAQHRKGVTIVMVTHDPELAERDATRIVRMADGEVVGDPGPSSARPTVQAAGEGA